MIFSLQLRDLVDYEMEEILSKVTNGDEQEAEKMRSSRSELTRSNLKCYEAVAKHYSQKCFSIARVSLVFNFHLGFQSRLDMCGIG